MALGIGQFLELGAVDRVVLTDIDVVSLFGNVQIGAVRNIAESLVLRGSHSNSIAVFAGFLPCFLGPLACDDIGGTVVAHEVHGHGCELGPGAALQEQHFVIVGNLKQVPQICLCLFDDAVKNFAAVAHFHDGHAASSVVEHFVGRFLKDFFGENGGACGKIIYSVHMTDYPPVKQC